MTWPVRAISYALPSTYAIRAMQDEMLRGIVQHPEDVWILAGAAAGLFAIAVLLFRREFRADRHALRRLVDLDKNGSADGQGKRTDGDHRRRDRTQDTHGTSHRHFDTAPPL